MLLFPDKSGWLKRGAVHQGVFDRALLGDVGEELLDVLVGLVTTHVGQLADLSERSQRFAVDVFPT